MRPPEHYARSSPDIFIYLNVLISSSETEPPVYGYLESSRPV